MLMKYRLFTPGPTSVPEATLLELAKPVHHHRTSEFRALFNECQALLQYVFQTKSQVYTITGSGTAAAEAGIVNTIGPGQRALVVTNGKFAERWSAVCTAFGIEHKDIKLEYGDHVSAEQIGSELRAAKYDAVILVHSETSTATVCNLEQIGRVVRTTGETLLIVDGITSIGALPFKMDDWGVDVAITGSQKSLMLPPGLAYLGLSNRAWTAIDKNKARRSFYLDLAKYRKSIEDGDTPFTPANTLIEAQRVSLKMIQEETLEMVWKRTHLIAEAFRQGVRALGFELFSKYPADSVTAVKYPAGITDKDFRNHLKNKHNIHLAGGQGSMEGKIFRVNHMGYTDAYDALAVVAAIEHALKALGKQVNFGGGVAATQKVLAELF
ncbi:MAG TPA: alanine--glyoxylate aminotransferase family protein [Tepidisphaeraceae bacterium]|jgi:aspartate aminotransferase-like enzyme|nr:alanine--glyoxylate aminotransferase family protein [Tepidisphaeraceae bacterium]